VLFAAESGIDLGTSLSICLPVHSTSPNTRRSMEPTGAVWRMTTFADGKLAILKYLADRRAPAYPADLRKRARQRARLLNTGFTGIFLFPIRRFFIHAPARRQRAGGHAAWGKDQALVWLKVLDQDLTDRAARSCGSDITIADYLCNDGPRQRSHRTNSTPIQTSALARQHEGAEELGEGQRGVLQVRGRPNKGEFVRV
jgi:hypothetical protein